MFYLIDQNLNDSMGDMSTDTDFLVFLFSYGKKGDKAHSIFFLCFHTILKTLFGPKKMFWLE